jgi:hypothetical protein
VLCKGVKMYNSLPAYIKNTSLITEKIWNSFEKFLI